MITDNPYSKGSIGHTAWQEGYCAGYDDNEQDWIKRTLPIVGELEESIRYDWEHNDCVQWSKLKLIFDAYYPFAPEHDWLEPLIKDAVKVQNENGWYMTPRERDAAECLGEAFGVSLGQEYRVTVRFEEYVYVTAADEDEAVEKALEEFRDEFSFEDIMHNVDTDVEEM